MAEYLLIDRYLGELGRHVGRVRHAEEILEEVADHLLEAVAVYLSLGLDHDRAQHRALLDFGEPDLVGDALASANSGGIAVPTTFTRRAGVALIISSVLLTLGIASQMWSSFLDRTRVWEDGPLVFYAVGAYTLMVAGLLWVVGVAGLNRRHGGTLGLAGRIAFWIAIPTALFLLATWFWPFWASALAVAGVSLSYGLVKAGLAPRSPAVAIGLGSATPLVVALVSTSADLFGSESTWDAGFVVAAAGVVVFAGGLGLVGSWMRSEEPVEQPTPMATA